MEPLENLFTELFSGTDLIRMIFSGKRRRSDACSRVAIRPLLLSGQLSFQAEYTIDTKVTHQNMNAGEAAAEALRLVREEFKQINIFTRTEDIQVLAAKADRPRITSGSATKGMPSLTHNKEKRYLLPDGTPCDFLIRLGVMEQDGKVIRRHYSKFRQINRFLEIVEDVFPELPQDRTLKIIDFGCGKAYLTFALWHYLRVIKQKDVEIIGLDLKKDVVAFCNKVASDLHCDGLQFLVGDIAGYKDDHADMVVTLHACDTATDYALINAVSWQSRVILSVPCCQHELFKQIHEPLHQPILKYGILKDRLTEYLTDGLRGLKLEAAGYDVAMIEFTTLEHTAKNIMIKAVRREPFDAARAERAQSQYEQLRDFYHVHPCIDALAFPAASDRRI